MSQRLALVIGNSDYASIEKLTNARNDAKAVKEALSSLGFRVIAKFNCDRADILETLDATLRCLHIVKEIVVYYSGHGVSSGMRVFFLFNVSFKYL